MFAGPLALNPTIQDILPDYAEAYYNLGITHLAGGDRGMALEEYKILKNLDPQLANKLFNLIYK